MRAGRYRDQHANSGTDQPILAGAAAAGQPREARRGPEGDEAGTLPGAGRRRHGGAARFLPLPRGASFDINRGREGRAQPVAPGQTCPSQPPDMPPRCQLPLQSEICNSQRTCDRLCLQGAAIKHSVGSTKGKAATPGQASTTQPFGRVTSLYQEAAAPAL